MSSSSRPAYGAYPTTFNMRVNHALNLLSTHSPIRVPLRGWPIVLLLTCAALAVLYVITRGSSSSPHHERVALETRFSSFAYWAQASDVQLSTALSLGHFQRPHVPGGVRGVRAVRAISKGETLVRVPAASMLVNSSQVLHLHGVRTSVLMEPAVELRWRRSCDACGIMAFVMLDERRPSHVSRWQPFLQLLELDAAVAHVHPMLFSSYRLSQQAPAVRLYVTETRRRLRACYEAVFNVDDSRVAAIVGGLSDPSPQFAFHRYVDAALECASHQFGVTASATVQVLGGGDPTKRSAGTDGTSRLLALIPGADLFAAPPESAPAQAKLRSVPGSLSPLVDDYVIEAIEDVPVGKEITADWFPRVCAEQQLCSYGYIYDTTTDSCPIE